MEERPFPNDSGLEMRCFLSKVQLWKDLDILCRGLCHYESALC